jgi:Protein of unknown function with HXXEE motif
MILFWILPLSVLLHIIEEFAIPGGFREWYQKYNPSIAPSLTKGFLITVNTVLIIMCFIPVLIATNPQGVALWLTLVAILFSNSLFHIAGGIKSRQYSPGIVTSILLYIPISIYGYWYFISTSQASIGTAIVAIILGTSYLWWSLYNHRKRAKAYKNKNQIP